ncbi:disulfide bond formation protein DsbA [Campylobacter anatolicus]|uniref:Ppx/GppA phosphatase family protein n=1 Tax=Campylobacter anatolicus TaxID=2829105 RepID=UPI001E55FEC9|nr:disulfide bond formation protein DsbA [Campylobacter anatolicus]
MNMVISIDLGSNTLRIALMHMRSDGSCEVMHSFERIVGSARGLKQSGEIGKEAVANIMAALDMAKDEFDFKNLPCVAVATAAFRVAQNSQEIFDEIWQKFGIKFQLIDGEREARLTFLGVKNAIKRLGLTQENIVCIDIGGASSEISDGCEFRSFDFGIITFYENFKADSKTQTIKNLRTNAQAVTLDATKFIKRLKKDTIILTSSVPTTMVAIKMGMNYAEYEANQINGSELKFYDFIELCEWIFRLDDVSADIAVGTNRRMPLIAGMILFEQILKDETAKLIVIDDGLREGVGVEYLYSAKFKG